MAASSFRESVRDKILFNFLFFALGLILFSLILGEWSVFAREKVIKDFTLAVMSLFSLAMAIFIGIGLLQREIQKKTVLTLLAKPVPRWHFIMGKYLGLVTVLGVNLALMTAFFYLVLWATDSHPQLALLKAVWLLFIEMGVITAAAILFSSFSTPITSSLFTFGTYVAGHLSGDIIHYLGTLEKYGSRVPGGIEMPAFLPPLAKGLYYLIPNLENFNVRGRVVHGFEVTGGYLAVNTLYGMAFIAVFLLITCLWFERRDFT